jgi:mRNA interferase RelE/StbE
MIVKIDKSFKKDTDKIQDLKLLIRIAKCILSIQNASDTSEINHLKKIKTDKNHFRIKIGDYRLGVIINGSEVQFIRCINRKDIYKYFPKK